MYNADIDIRKHHAYLDLIFFIEVPDIFVKSQKFDYVHVLEDDTITVYGTFEGMEDSTNFLNGEKSKGIALHVKYAKLVEE